ncbi:Butyrophilin subfamily 1 member A1, partial [Varanus komodoensis]
MRANELKLNPDKTEVLLVGGSGFRVGDLDLVLNGVALPLKDRVRSLGVLLDPELSLKAQVTAVARSAFLQLRLIHQLPSYLENDCLETVTHVLVTFQLDVCNALYLGLPLKMVWIFQMVQNRAARLLTGTGRYVHMTPVLRQLHWLPIEVWAQFKVLVITYKALNSLGPGYLKEHLHPYMPSHPLRSATEALLREPSMKDTRRAFSVVAPNLWNELPREVRLVPSLFVFWSQAKTFLFKRYFGIIPPPNPVIGSLGKEVILPCQLKISSISGSGDLKLSWILDKSTEKIIVKTYTQNKNTSDSRYQGRAELFYDELNKGNMSLILKKSQLIDQGKYSCMVESTSWYDEVAIELILTAKGVDPTITLRDYKGQGIGLTCASEGWYPKPQALWLSSKGENRTEKEITTSTENAAGTFSIFSAITIEPGTASEVSCKIFSSVLQQESESRIMIADTEQDTRRAEFRRLQSHAAAVTLDSEYKHPEIIISEDKRKASLKAPTPGQPGAAVETLIVVGKEGYAAGKHYWEVR